MPLQTENIQILFTASVTLVSILAAVIGFLLALYSEIKGRANAFLKDYRNLIILMLGVLFLGMISSFISLSYLLGAYFSLIYYLAIGLFILLILMIFIGLSSISYKIINEE